MSNQYLLENCINITKSEDEKCMCDKVDYKYTDNVKNYISYLEEYGNKVSLCFKSKYECEINVLTKDNIIKSFPFKVSKYYKSSEIDNMLLNHILFKFAIPEPLDKTSMENLFGIQYYNDTSYITCITPKYTSFMHHIILNMLVDIKLYIDNKDISLYEDQYTEMLLTYRNAIIHFNINYNSYIHNDDINDKILIHNTRICRTNLIIYLINRLKEESMPSYQELYAVIYHLSNKFNDSDKTIFYIIDFIEKYPLSTKLIKDNIIRIFSSKNSLREYCKTLLANYIVYKTRQEYSKSICIYDAIEQYIVTLSKQKQFPLYAYILQKLNKVPFTKLLLLDFFKCDQNNIDIDLMLKYEEICNYKYYKQKYKERYQKLKIRKNIKEIIELVKKEYIDYVFNDKYIGWSPSESLREEYNIKTNIDYLKELYNSGEYSQKVYEKVIDKYRNKISISEECNRYINFVFDTLIMSFNEHLEKYCPFSNNYLIHI